MLQVVAILEQTKSSYLATFLSLRKAIQQEAVVAEDNLKFLQCLEQPCRTLASATAKVPPFCLADVNAHAKYPPQALSQSALLLSRYCLTLSWMPNPTINTSGSLHSVRLQHGASSSAGFDPWASNLCLCSAGHSQDSALGAELRAHDLELEPVLQHTRAPCWPAAQAQQ